MRIVKPIAITDSNLVSSSVPENDYPAYVNTTLYSLGNKVMVPALHRNFECIKQESAVVTCSTSGSATIGWVKHGLVNGRVVKFTTTGTLPAGIIANTNYYVINSTQDSFNISTSSGGAAVVVSSAGSGALTATASVSGFSPETSPTYWLDLGSTNRYKMFDTTVQSQTVSTTSVTVKILATSAVDTVTLLNLTGTSVTVSVYHPATASEVYSSTTQLLQDDSPVVDLLSYLTSEFKLRKDVILEGIPPYNTTEVTVTIQGNIGSNVGIGALLIGKARDISHAKKGVEQGAKLGITDYSIKTRDAFGNYVITQRAFSRRSNYTIYINNNELDDIYNLLSDLRSVPTLYLGSGKYASTAVYGFYKSWELDIAYPEFSVCSIELDGLT